MTTWKENTAGKLDTAYDVSDEMGEPALLIASQPDWIRYPADFPPELAGKTAQVTSCEMVDVICALCGVKAPRKVLTSEHGICVISCKHCGQYAWLKKEELSKLC